MSERHHKDWLKAFLDYSSFSEAPSKFLFWTGISTIAGALRRRVWLDMKEFQWVPNFYIIIVAPPGVVSKTTTINMGMKLLREVGEINFGPDVVTWQALVTEFTKAQEHMHFEKTDEYLPMSCLTFASGEFGNFLNPHDQEMVNLLISLWDGQAGKFSKVTKMSGNDSIENPWINLIACTTPDWIAGNFPEYMIGGGFTSRCIFVFADKKRQYVAYPDRAAPPDYYEKRASLVHDLEIISQLQGEFTLTDSARAWGEEWYTKHWTTDSRKLDSAQFGGYYARKQTHIHKIAMVLSAAQSNDLTIQDSHLMMAESFITALEHDMPSIYGRIGQNELTKGAHQIVEILKQKNQLERQDLYAMLFRSLSYRDFELALQSCISAGHIQQIQSGDKLILRIR
jgi:hypothetical protein